MLFLFVFPGNNGLWISRELAQCLSDPSTTTASVCHDQQWEREGCRASCGYNGPALPCTPWLPARPLPPCSSPHLGIPLPGFGFNVLCYPLLFLFLLPLLFPCFAVCNPFIQECVCHMVDSLS